MTKELEIAFWKRVSILGPDDCWLWLGSIHKDGPGIVSSAQRELYGSGYAHRIAWILTNGPIPDELQVCHSCDNPPCCNPKHLWLGTQADNMADMDAKGRRAVGEAHGLSKLTVDQVKEIRLAYKPGVNTQRGLAIQFNVSQLTISAVTSGEDWKHVDGLIDYGDIRHKITRHERNPNAKLTQKDIGEIRDLYSKGGITQFALGKRFGISQGYVTKIISGWAWRD